MKRYYRNNDFIIYWNISQNQKNQLIRMINQRFPHYLNEKIEDTIEKIEDVIGVININELEINICVYKDDAFYDAKN